MSASKVKRSDRGDFPRVTDFRRELTFREKKVAEIKRERMRTLADVKQVPKFMITVDLSHARGNLDAVRTCLRELEWKEVIVFGVRGRWGVGVIVGYNYCWKKYTNIILQIFFVIESHFFKCYTENLTLEKTACKEDRYLRPHTELTLNENGSLIVKCYCVNYSLLQYTLICVLAWFHHHFIWLNFSKNTTCKRLHNYTD